MGIENQKAADAMNLTKRVGKLVVFMLLITSVASAQVIPSQPLPKPSPQILQRAVTALNDQMRECNNQQLEVRMRLIEAIEQIELLKKQLGEVSNAK